MTLPSKYALGIPEIDAQHERWLDLIELFHDASKGNLASKEASDAAKRTLSELISYTSEHFSTEEEFMASTGFPGMAEHKMAHDRIFSALSSLAREMSENPRSPSVSLRLGAVTSSWLLGHIVTEDRKYAEHALSASEGFSPRHLLP